MAESQPLEDWHRGYISGYEEGYQAGLEPEPAPKRALPWTSRRRRTERIGSQGDRVSRGQGEGGQWPVMRSASP